MSPSSLYYIAGMLVTGGTTVYGIYRHFHAKLRREARLEVLNYIKDTFIVDMATNHLPHVYHALELLCSDRGIEIGDPPPIKFFNFPEEK